ncbi:MAG: hypothetical protein HZA48_03905 [Planctomycetes bacterium]|nr:hypothetical protein [Planctomycetota bacterium]
MAKFEKTILIMSKPVFIGLNDWAYSNLTVISTDSGEILWTGVFPKGIVKAIAIGNNVTVCSRYGWLYTYEWHLK